MVVHLIHELSPFIPIVLVIAVTNVWLSSQERDWGLYKYKVTDNRAHNAEYIHIEAT